MLSIENEAQRSQILADNQLNPPPELQIGTTGALLKTLDAFPVSDWADKRAALPGRVAKAREEAAKMLMPKAVKVWPSPATLKTELEVDLYLKKLRETIIEHVKAGNPVII